MDVKKHSIALGGVKHFAAGIWIIFLYVLFLVAVLFSLTIYQFQREIEAISIDNTSLVNGDVFVDHKCDVSGIKNVDFESSLILLPCIRRPVDEKVSNITASDILRNQSFNSNLYKNKISFTKARIASIERELLESENDDFRISILKGNIFRAKLDLNSYQQELVNFENIESSIRKIAQDSKFYDSLFSMITPNNEFENIWTIPEILLSIFLALSMGGLGSLITVTIEYLKIEKDDYEKSGFSKYVFRPMLGSIMALAVYIAIKSGQVSISGDVVTELSPFLLSFMGILSGIMSEQVYRRLVNYGENVI